jgi:hypothetical protein
MMLSWGLERQPIFRVVEYHPKEKEAWSYKVSKLAVLFHCIYVEHYYLESHLFTRQWSVGDHITMFFLTLKTLATLLNRVPCMLNVSHHGTLKSR